MQSLDSINKAIEKTFDFNKRDVILCYAVFFGSMFLGCCVWPFSFLLMLHGAAAYHEVGHAIMGWLDGYATIPAVIVALPISIPYVTPVVIVSFSLLAKYLLSVGHLIWGVLFAFLAAYSFITNLFFSARWGEQGLLLGGVAGEFILPLFALLLFFARFPEKVSWNRNRWLIFISAGTTLWTRTLTFYDGNVAKLPMGGVTDSLNKAFGETESHGDMDRLIRDFGWSPIELVSFYWTILFFSWIFFILFTLYVVDKAFDGVLSKKINKYINKPGTHNSHIPRQ